MTLMEPWQPNIYDNRDDFNFPIVKYPFLDSNIRHILPMVFTCRSWFDIREPVIFIKIFYIDLSVNEEASQSMFHRN